MEFKDERRLKGKTILRKFPPTKTQQQFEKDTNANIIMSNYKRGIMPKFTSQGEYVNQYDIPANLVDAYDRIDQMNDEFSKLPAHIREQFKNDPRLFVQFVSDPRNEPEFNELFGIKKKEPDIPTPTPTPTPDLAPDTKKRPQAPLKEEEA